MSVGDQSDERTEIELIELREVHIDDVVEQVLPDVAPEEEPSLTDDVVEEEEAVGLF
jgi:hypothetical protein